MGQQEVIKILEREDRWMSISEVVKESSANTSSVAAVLRKLAEQGEILRSYVDMRHRVQLKYCIKND